MELKLIETLSQKYLSEARFRPYLQATSNDINKAIKLYQIYNKIAMLFFNKITQFEVIFKNSLHDSLFKAFDQYNWLYLQQNNNNGYLNSSICDEVLLSELNSALRKIDSNQQKDDTLISKTHFGLWTSFYNSHNYTALGSNKKYLLKDGVFPKIDKHNKRNSIDNRLSTIRKLIRNKISHCESIIFREDQNFKFDCGLAKKGNKHIHELINWMNPDLEEMLLNENPKSVINNLIIEAEKLVN